MGISDQFKEHNRDFLRQRSGDRESVRFLQENLEKVMGEFVPDGHEGFMNGNLTVDKIKDFQTQVGIAPDGVVGPTTWYALEKAVEAGGVTDEVKVAALEFQSQRVKGKNLEEARVAAQATLNTEVEEEVEEKEVAETPAPAPATTIIPEAVAAPKDEGIGFGPAFPGGGVLTAEGYKELEEASTTLNSFILPGTNSGTDNPALTTNSFPFRPGQSMGWDMFNQVLKNIPMSLADRNSPSLYDVFNGQLGNNNGLTARYSPDFTAAFTAIAQGKEVNLDDYKSLTVMERFNLEAVIQADKDAEVEAAPLPPAAPVHEYTVTEIKNYTPDEINGHMDTIIDRYGAVKDGETPEQKAERLSRPAVVLDLGHFTRDGKIEGATGIDGISEADINLYALERAAHRYKEMGYSVYFTHSDEAVSRSSNSNFGDIAPRERYAEKVIADHNGRGVFISFHSNDYSASANGFEIVVDESDLVASRPNPTNKGLDLASTYVNFLQSAGLVTKDRQAGDAAATLYLRRQDGITDPAETGNPAGVLHGKGTRIIIENGFVGNAGDMEKILNSGFLDMSTQQLVAATNQFVAEQGSWLIQDGAKFNDEIWTAAMSNLEWDKPEALSQKRREFYEEFIPVAKEALIAMREKYPNLKLPSIEELVVMAAYESGHGTSDLAEHHNYFGLKANSYWQGDRVENYTTKEKDQSETIQADFKKFATMQEGIEGFIEHLATRNFGDGPIYARVFDPENKMSLMEAVTGKNMYHQDTTYVNVTGGMLDKFSRAAGSDAMEVLYSFNNRINGSGTTLQPLTADLEREIAEDADIKYGGINPDKSFAATDIPPITEKKAPALGG